mmetsp:Transcript_11341/g.16020  ORF Transcript_11341/g.16020 Transcript_11341/m.16020 type:complete len:125 (-) Transcript_11341:104-478(-)
MMDYIFARNQDTSPKTRPPIIILLSGAAIGNGWIDPYHQYSALDLTYSIGLIDNSQLNNLRQNEHQCYKEIEDGNLSPSICYSLLDKIVYQSNILPWWICPCRNRRSWTWIGYSQCETCCELKL